MSGSSATFATVAKAPTTSASQLVAGRPAREMLSVQNLGAGDLYVGGSDVTTSNGIKVAANETYVFDNFSAALYGIASAGTLDVRVGEAY